MQLWRFLTLDYRLLSVPTVTSEYIESNMKVSYQYLLTDKELSLNPVLHTIKLGRYQRGNQKP
jgi:hypothetical protein